eukprot:g724.t1
MVRHQQVCLVSGETGCGKTTQVPQFILDSFIQRGRGGECSIVCTQPRRIAAMGVAARVADERTEQVGGTVGYQVRMDKKATSATRLLFCTTGVLLRKMLNDRQLVGVTHLLVDEVHERSIETDFLLSIVRDLLPRRRDLRVILMSATMQDNLFARYFGAKSATGTCPMIQIPGRTFPVAEHFLEDVLETTGYSPRRWRKAKADAQRWSGGERRSYSAQTCELMTAIDEKATDYEMLGSLVSHLHAVRGGTGAMLVFLPGVPEIGKAQRELERSEYSSKLWVLPLHGGLLPQEQRLVFRRAPGGRRKVVLATNIAETSITIDDIEIVIDSGKVKEMRFDPFKQMACLAETWVSQAAATQRKGRAGRVKAGDCYKLFSRRTFQKMDPQQTAEIHRSRDEDVKHEVEINRKKVAARCGKSDHLVFAEAFAEFRDAKDKRKFCNQLGLSIDGMNNVKQLRAEYARELQSIGFLHGSITDGAVNVHSGSIRMVSAALCAGLYNNILHVIRPTQKYHETADGSVAAQGKARELQFYLWPEREPEVLSRPNAYDPLWWRGERAHIHPGSCNFEVGEFQCPWLVFHEKVRTTRLWIRESTMVTPYSLLLFGGKLEVLHKEGTVCVDRWVRFQAVARIGVLVKALRAELDKLLGEKVMYPDMDIYDTPLMVAIETLLQSDGM